MTNPNDHTVTIILDNLDKKLVEHFTVPETRPGVHPAPAANPVYTPATTPSHVGAVLDCLEAFLETHPELDAAQLRVVPDKRSQFDNVAWQTIWIGNDPYTVTVSKRGR